MLRKNNILIYIAFAFLAIGLYILIFSGRKPQPKPAPHTCKCMITPTATPSATLAPNNSVNRPIMNFTQPQAIPPGTQGQPNQQQVQEIHNDGTSTQQQSPTQPTQAPQPTKICLPIVGCL